MTSPYRVRAFLHIWDAPVKSNNTKVFKRWVSFLNPTYDYYDSQLIYKEATMGVFAFNPT
ncbi:hypothetical protein H6G24_28125 [Calothrix parietina FACHB-288]|uniref:Uncharacterized protein n=1 Tax=Calothrix parietina FACHB-288 TaxID=2692896 RepID=A0ABR8AH83_9CYAN|nr:hypothetical protein [Calothrix parietina FACHB-288]